MKIRNVIIVLWGVIILTSCATPKTVSYFPNLSDGDKMIVKESKGILLKPADKISIIVNTKSVELNNILNLPVTSQIIGYTGAIPSRAMWLQLSAQVYPENCDQSVIWTSSDPSVAAVDANGLVTAVGRGENGTGIPPCG